MTTRRDHAVVLGGSLAGLLAARVLADTYTHVTIVERDLLPSTPAHRRGVPHGQHVHGLLPRGRQVIEGLLPGITEELIAAGALPGDVLNNVRWYLHGRQLRQAHTDLLFISASRPLIEGTIRDRVRQLPNVTILDGQDIVGLRPSIDRLRITGVRITSPYSEVSQILPSDLVVDATGRGSRTPRWLADLCFASPAQDRVGIELHYSSRRFAVPEELFGDDVVIVTSRFPGQKRSWVMQRLEDGSVLVTLAGVAGERPPLDLEEGLAYAKTLAVQDTYEVMRQGRALDLAVAQHLPRYVKRRYEDLVDFPAGLLVVGDAVCNFNPVYGTGMSVAALNAEVLAAELAHAGEPDSRRYFAAAAQTAMTAWLLSVGPDMGIEGVTGPELPPSPLTPEYLRSLQLGSAEDARLAEAFIRVTSLVDPPPALLRPEIVALAAKTRTALVA